MIKRKVLITGSSRGLGRCLAFVFSGMENDIIIHGRDLSQLEAIKKHIDMEEFSGECTIVHGDITSSNTIQRLRDAAFQMDIDILINNAGIYGSGLFSEMKLMEARQIIDVNMIAPIELIKKIYPLFEMKKSGLIININSIAGKVPNSLEAVYCASKHGLRGFFKSFQFEAIQNNVKVLDVYLGAMKTDLTRTREDRDELINPVEAANTIYSLAKDYESLRISEVEIFRSKY